MDIDPETGIQELRNVSQHNEDIYPASVVQEDPGGIQGSCLHYRERKEANSLVRTETQTPRLSLQEAHTQSVHKHTHTHSQYIHTVVCCDCLLRVCRCQSDYS